MILPWALEPFLQCTLCFAAPTSPLSSVFALAAAPYPAWAVRHPNPTPPSHRIPRLPTPCTFRASAESALLRLPHMISPPAVTSTSATIHARLAHPHGGTKLLTPSCLPAAFFHTAHPRPAITTPPTASPCTNVCVTIAPLHCLLRDLDRGCLHGQNAHSQHLLRHSLFLRYPPPLYARRPDPPITGRESQACRHPRLHPLFSSNALLAPCRPANKAPRIHATAPPLQEEEALVAALPCPLDCSRTVAPATLWPHISSLLHAPCVQHQIP